MSATTLLGPWKIQVNSMGAMLTTSACDQCVACQTGQTRWCIRTAGERDVLQLLGIGNDSDPNMAAIACLSAVDRAGVPADVGILLLVDRTFPKWMKVAVETLTRARVLCATDRKDPVIRSFFSNRPFGRPDVVVVWAAVRDAAKAVRRGGIVCVGSTDPAMPSITETVQRELHFVGPGDLSDRLVAIFRDTNQIAWTSLKEVSLN